MSDSVFRILIGLTACLITVEAGNENLVEIVTPETIGTTTTTMTTTVKTTMTSAPTTESRVPEKRKPVLWATNDSYIQAYLELHRKSPAKRNDQNDQNDPSDNSYNTVIRSSVFPEHKYPSLTNQEHWIQPQPHQSTFPTYGSYHYHHYEEIPSTSWHGKPYSSPSLGLLDILPKKLSLKLLFKIILKLVLFKMIVKFIAVICLLLFIPVLKSKGSQSHGGHDDDEMRKLQHLDEVSNIIWNSISGKEEVYGDVNDEKEEEEKPEEDVEDYEEEEEELKDMKKIVEKADKEEGTSL